MENIPAAAQRREATAVAAVALTRVGQRRIKAIVWKYQRLVVVPSRCLLYTLPPRKYR